MGIVIPSREKQIRIADIMMMGKAGGEKAWLTI